MTDWRNLKYRGRPCYVETGNNWIDYYPTGAPKHVTQPRQWSIVAADLNERFRTVYDWAEDEPQDEESVDMSGFLEGWGR